MTDLIETTAHLALTMKNPENSRNEIVKVKKNIDGLIGVDTIDLAGRSFIVLQSTRGWHYIPVEDIETISFQETGL